jgi:hypothetical protein
MATRHTRLRPAYLGGVFAAAHSRINKRKCWSVMDLALEFKITTGYAKSILDALSRIHCVVRNDDGTYRPDCAHSLGSEDSWQSLP